MGPSGLLMGHGGLHLNSHRVLAHEKRVQKNGIERDTVLSEKTGYKRNITDTGEKRTTSILNGFHVSHFYNTTDVTGRSFL